MQKLLLDNKTRLTIDRMYTLEGKRLAEYDDQFFFLDGSPLTDMALAEQLPAPHRARAIAFVQAQDRTKAMDEVAYKKKIEEIRKTLAPKVEEPSSLELRYPDAAAEAKSPGDTSRLAFQELQNEARGKGTAGAVIEYVERITPPPTPTPPIVLPKPPVVPTHPIVKPPTPGVPTNPIVTPPPPGKPDHTLPGTPQPGHDLPNPPGRPMPPTPPKPDHTLPGQSPRPDHTLPGGGHGEGEAKPKR